MRKLLDLLPAGVILIDSAGRVAEANPAPPPSLLAAVEAEIARLESAPAAQDN